MQLVSKNDKILRTICYKFDFNNAPFDPISFAKKIIEFIHKNKGISISANQIGIPYRVFGIIGEPENFVCYNPRIVDSSVEEIILEEKSFTYPGIYIKVRRPRAIRVRFNTPNSDIMTKQFTGMTARVIQQEIDQLNGINLGQKCSKLRLEMAIKRAKKLGFEYKISDFYTGV